MEWMGREVNSARDLLETALEAKLEFKRLERRVESLSARSLQFSLSSESEHVREIHHLLGLEVVRELSNMQRCSDHLDAADELIEQIPDAAYRNLLRYRYFDDATHTQMQMRLLSDLHLHYSERTITRMLKAAKDEAQKVWENLHDPEGQKTDGKEEMYD